MGWTNSHLHRFEIQSIVRGDPELLCDDPDSFIGTNSLGTKVSDIVPQLAGYQRVVPIVSRWA